MRAWRCGHARLKPSPSRYPSILLTPNASIEARNRVSVGSWEMNHKIPSHCCVVLCRVCCFRGILCTQVVQNGHGAKTVAITMKHLNPVVYTCLSMAARASAFPEPRCHVAISVSHTQIQIAIAWSIPSNRFVVPPSPDMVRVLYGWIRVAEAKGHALILSSANLDRACRGCL